MKNLLLLLVAFFLSQSSKAMIIENIVVTPINTQDINIYLKVKDGSVFSFSNSSYVIESNTITLTCCYNTLYFLAVTTLENEFVIPNINLNTSNYNLVVIVNFQNFPNNICEYSVFSDTETISFTTPLNGAVSLSNSSFEKNIDTIKLYPNPTSGLIKLEGIDTKTYSISVIDNLGREVVAQKEIINKTIDISNLTEGYYFIKMNTDKGTFVKKIVLEK